MPSNNHPKFLVGKIVAKKDCVQGVGRFDSLKGVAKGRGYLDAGDGAPIEVRFLAVGETMGSGIFESTDPGASGLEKGMTCRYLRELAGE